MQSTAAPRVVAAPRIDAGLALLAYAALVLYGSLYPFSDWVASPDPFAFVFRPLSETRFSLGDVFTNFFAYVPLGLLACRHFLRSAGPTAAVLSAAAAGFALSFGVEVAQAFLPSRVQSNLDLLMNTAGTALGALAAGLSVSRARTVQRALEARREWLVTGGFADVALIGLSAWTLSWLVPFVPSLDVGKFRASLAPLAAALAQPKTVSAWLALSEALSWAGFGLVLRAIVRPEKPASKVVMLFAGAVLLAQIPIVGRHLTLELVIGCLAGALLAGLLARAQPRATARLAFFLLFAGFCVGEIVAAPPGRLYPFNWVPFRAHLINTAYGIGSLLEATGVCVCLAWAARSASDERSQRWTPWVAGLLAVGAAFVLELAQRRVPGRTGDVTVPLLFAFGWIAAWRTYGRNPAPVAPLPPAAQITRPEMDTGSRTVLVRFLLLWAAVTTAIWVISRSPSVPYNVRELIYPGHPWRSAAFLSAALGLTIGLPAWLAAWRMRAGRRFFLWPVALLLDAYVVWLLVLNAVPSESIHDIVGAPILGWTGQTESCLRFLAVHLAVTLSVSGGVMIALVLFHPRRAAQAVQWLAWALVFAPLLHWVIVSQAATDNLTELMRNGGSPSASALLAAGAVLTFASGSLVSASAGARRLWIGSALAACCAAAAYGLFAAGSEPAIVKYGKVFSAMQFLLSPDRTRYVADGALVARYAIACLSLTVLVALVQHGAWRAMTRKPGP